MNYSAMIAIESPLAGMTIGDPTRVAIRELPALRTIDLRVAPGTPGQEAVAAALGMDLPAKPGFVGRKPEPGGSETLALCLAPDWWLIVGSGEAKQNPAQLQLNEQYHFSAVDVSGQRTTIELEGPNAGNVLAHLWDQDLREKSFPVASVSQGLMAKAPVIVYHMAPFSYRVMVRSSFALHLWKALADAAEEWL